VACAVTRVPYGWLYAGAVLLAAYASAANYCVGRAKTAGALFYPAIVFMFGISSWLGFVRGHIHIRKNGHKTVTIHRVARLHPQRDDLAYQEG
jgi:hypothetical protein